jgi:hypothetical protein
MDALREAHAIVRGEVQRDPGNDNGPLQRAVEGEQESNAGRQYGAARVAVQARGGPTDQLKRLATARARAALRGVVVHAMPDDTGRPEYVVTQGPWTVALKSLDELEAWLDRIEGRRRPDAAGAAT